MSKKEKPLPKPPNQAFGGKKRFEEETNQSSLLADKMAQAMAEGKLDEFLKKEMPDNEYARNLAGMMMGMTGMMMPGATAPAMTSSPEKTEQPEAAAPDQEGAAAEVPEDVRHANQSGDVAGLMTMLRREHQKRSGGGEPAEAAPAPEAAPSTSAQGTPSIDKDLIDALIKIAQDNEVTLDWMILRAIKVYVQEYKKTGKL